MIGIHWSCGEEKLTSIEQLYAIPVEEQNDGTFMGANANPHRVMISKPRGLWFSPEDAEHTWHDWCHSEDFATERFTNKVSLDIDESRLLVIDSGPALMDFSEKYGRDAYDDFDFEGRDQPNFKYWTIDWQKVQGEYDGIVISPYQWEYRLHFGGPFHDVSNWYYPWDCASGCIWNPECVRTLTHEEIGETAVG